MDFALASLMSPIVLCNPGQIQSFQKLLSVSKQVSFPLIATFKFIGAFFGICISL